MRLTTAVLLLVTVAGFAQQTAPPPLTQKIEVTLVNVEVTVLDTRGNPVADLKKEDFEVREDGVPQEITNFNVVKNEVAASKPQQPSFVSDPDRRRSVVVLVDVRAMGEKPQRARAVDALQKMIAQYPDDSKWSIVVLRSGMRSMITLLPMTNDRAALNEALVAVRNGVSLPGSAEAAIRKIRAVGAAGGDLRAGIDAAQDIDAAVSFFSAVIEVARGVSWVPGKKVILIVSSSVPGYVKPGTPNAEALAQVHQKMVEETNAAGANIYIIDPLGVSASLDMGQGNFAAKAANVETATGQRAVGGAVWLTAETGGLYLPSNDMRESLEKVERATMNYYELAYHAREADDKYHHITVTLKRPGRYTITHREGYQRLSKEESFTRAMTSPLGIASQTATLPVQLKIEQQQLTGGDYSVSYRAAIPVKALQSLVAADGRTARAHVYVSAFDSEGRLVKFSHSVETMSGVSENDDRWLIVSRALGLQKGTYRLFVTIRDEVTDSVGVAMKEISL